MGGANSVAAPKLAAKEAKTASQMKRTGDDMKSSRRVPTGGAKKASNSCLSPSAVAPLSTMDENSHEANSNVNTPHGGKASGKNPTVFPVDEAVEVPSDAPVILPPLDSSQKQSALESISNANGANQEVVYELSGSAVVRTGVVTPRSPQQDSVEAKALKNPLAARVVDVEPVCCLPMATLSSATDNSDLVMTSTMQEFGTNVNTAQLPLAEAFDAVSVPTTNLSLGNPHTASNLSLMEDEDRDLMSILPGLSPKKGASDIDFRPIHSAIRWDKPVEEIAVLLISPAHANVMDPVNGNYPIHIAAQNGHSHLVSLLLERGADVNAVNMKGNTALHMSVGYDYHDTSQLLIRNGAELEALNDSGFPARRGLEGDKTLGVIALIAAQTREEAISAMNTIASEGDDIQRVVVAQAGFKARRAIGADWTPDLASQLKEIVSKLS